MVETGILPGSGSFPYKKHRNTYLLLKTLPQIKIVGTSLKNWRLYFTYLICIADTINICPTFFYGKKYGYLNDLVRSDEG